MSRSGMRSFVAAKAEPVKLAPTIHPDSVIARSATHFTFLDVVCVTFVEWRIGSTKFTASIGELR